MSARNFDGGPSIVELFFSAKKLLSLQPRVQNRQLRKDNYRCQKSHAVDDDTFDRNARGHTHDKVLDLLSPLSIDDLKNSPPYAQRNTVTPGTSKARGTTSTTTTQSNAKFTASAVSTPSSLNSPPREKSSPTAGMPVSAPTSNLTSSLRAGSNANSSTNLNTLPGKPTECTNCHTLNTPLWRKDTSGNTLCNACGLFYKLHGTTRPLSLKTDVIKKRSSRRSASSTRHSSVTGLSSSFGANSNFGAISIPGGPVNIAASNTHLLSGSLNRSQSSVKFNPIYNGNSSISLQSASTFSNSLPNSASLARHKNVLILPKPLAANGSPGTPGTPNARSIPIPRNGSQQSLVSSPSASSPYSNQPFKRKKSDYNIAGSVAASNGEYYDSSFGKRSTSSSLSGSLTMKRSSVGRSNSQSSLQLQMHQQHHQNSPNGQMSFPRKQSSNDSLTMSNINLLNQRYTPSSYFDSPHNTELSRHSSATTLTGIPHSAGIPTGASTPGSNGSFGNRQSFSSIPDFRRSEENHRLSQSQQSQQSQQNLIHAHTPFNSETSSIPATPMNVVDLLPSSVERSDIDMDLDDGNSRNRIQSGSNASANQNGMQNNYFKFQPNSNTNSPKSSTNTNFKSSLSNGLKKQMAMRQAQQPQKSASSSEAKDLDWLKFEL